MSASRQPPSIGLMEIKMSDLNNANPHPPEEAQAKLREAEERSRQLNTPERTNDSTIQPEKPDPKILDGFHGG
ncbi:MAG: hypothetical protein JWP60_904 [Ramlibacter sp.]|nr:hypothetical protein [Ramlibacter sp.]